MLKHITRQRCVLPGPSSIGWETPSPRPLFISTPGPKICPAGMLHLLHATAADARDGGSPGSGEPGGRSAGRRSEEHTSELQSRLHLVCRLLLEKKKK